MFTRKFWSKEQRAEDASANRCLCSDLIKPEPDLKPCCSQKITFEMQDLAKELNGNAENCQKTCCSQQCDHPAHGTAALMHQIPTEAFGKKLQKYSEETCGSGAAQMNGLLNNIFLQRLTEIETQGNGDVNCKLITYQEWVDMLLRVNSIIITNMEDLETRVASRFEAIEDVNCAPPKEFKKCEEIRKLRKDIKSLVKFIQRAFYQADWSMCNLQLETLTPADVLGMNDDDHEKLKRTLRKS